jgi:hypothetical protein
MNFTGTSRVLHRLGPRSSPVNFTEFPRVHVPVNNKVPPRIHLQREVDTIRETFPFVQVLPTFPATHPQQ